MQKNMYERGLFQIQQIVQNQPIYNYSKGTNFNYCTFLHISMFQYFSSMTVPLFLWVLTCEKGLIGKWVSKNRCSIVVVLSKLIGYLRAVFLTCMVRKRLSHLILQSLFFFFLWILQSLLYILICWICMTSSSQIKITLFIRII